MTEDAALELELAALLVEAVDLDIEPQKIDVTEPLFGDEGLGLDSIDALELALAVAVKYGFQMRAEDARKNQAFENLQSLGKYIQANRTKWNPCRSTSS